MSKSMAQQVAEFNDKILCLPPRWLINEPIIGLSDADIQLSHKQLMEEVCEWEDADLDNNLPGQVDAMLDLIYFALGILYKMGLSPLEIDILFEAVHAANMTKSIGKKKGRIVEGAIDAVKPADFKDPKNVIEGIINGRNNRK
jgi:predicted HAD superfamily Cof-like phosphohydrolase